MGLDITAYSHLRHVGHHPVDEEETDGFCDTSWDEETCERIHIPAYSYSAFPHALLGLPDVKTVTLGHTEFFLAGCFEKTEHTESYGFRAGSYSGYSYWRNELRERYNAETRPEGPFYELIWFADNEGTLAQQAATSLLGEFRRFEKDYAASHHGYDLQRYKDWTIACQLAADGGLIDFH